jgi:NAD(P)H-hydrate epimerase
MRRDLAFILTPAEMAAADHAAIAGGISGQTLMEAAGWQVARLVRQHFRPRQLLVLCGPGNNGGDGLVAARVWRRWGWPVRVALLGEVAQLRGDAAEMAKRWNAPLPPIDRRMLDSRPLVVDALFGAGLARPLGGFARQLVEELTQRRLDVVAIDLPSGARRQRGNCRRGRSGGHDGNLRRSQARPSAIAGPALLRRDRPDRYRPAGAAQRVPT